MTPLAANIWLGIVCIAAPVVLVLIIAAALWLRDLYQQCNEAEEFDPPDQEDRP